MPAKIHISLSKGELYQLYIVEGKTMIQLGKLLNISAPTVARLLRENDIPVRLWKVKKNPKPSILNAEIVQDLYVNQRKSSAEIGKMFNRTGNTVIVFLKKNNIPIRPPQERKKGKTITEEQKRKLSQIHLERNKHKRFLVKCSTCGQEKIILTRAYVKNKNHFCNSLCQKNFKDEVKSIERLKLFKQKKADRKRASRSPEGRNWRKEVFARDNNICRICFSICDGVKLKPHPHHIQRFNDYPDLRFDINNGITLCKNCHEKTYNKEYLYESYLTSDIKYRSIESTNC